MILSANIGSTPPENAPALNDKESTSFATTSATTGVIRKVSVAPSLADPSLTDSLPSCYSTILAAVKPLKSSMTQRRFNPKCFATWFAVTHS